MMEPGEPLPTVGSDCRSDTGQCEFATLSASQLSTAAIVLAYVVIRIGKVVIAKGTDFDGIQLTIVSAITIIYIFLCLVLIEDIYIASLRSLRPWYRWMEFGLRVAVLVAISILPTFLDLIPTLPHHSTAPDRIANFLIIVYVVFLTWDFVVAVGAPASPLRATVRKIVLGFAITDGIGFLLLSAAAGTRYASQAAGAVVLFFVIPFAMVFQIGRAVKDLRESRFQNGFGRRILR